MPFARINPGRAILREVRQHRDSSRVCGDTRECAHYARQAGANCPALQAGLLSVPDPTQLTQPPAPGATGATPELLNTVGALAQAAMLRHQGGSSPTAPDTAIISLIRPAGGLHSQGRAADISIYAGQHLDIFHPDEEVPALVALLHDLPPGFYAFGLPRLPRASGSGAGADYERYQKQYHFYVEQPNVTPLYPELTPESKVLRNPLQFPDGVAPNMAPPGGTIDAELDALLDSSARATLKQAVQEARTRGVFLMHVAPDAPDHVHLGTGPTAEDVRHF